MNYIVFFISTLLVISFIYYLILKLCFEDTEEKIVRWFFFLLINAITIVVNYYAFKWLSEIEKTDYSIAYPIGITILMFFVRNIYKYILTSSNSFLSTKDESLYLGRKYRKVEEFDANTIAIYPRFTIWDSESDSNQHMIFDSSDFVVVNKAFGVFEDYPESFLAGREFKFKDEKMLAEKVQVDFIS